MCEMESGLNDRLDLITFQGQKSPQKSEEMSGIIASTRISDRWALLDQSLEKVLPHVEKVEAADLEGQRKTLTGSRRCNCTKILRRQTKSLWASTWRLSWSGSATSYHLKTCQYWYPSQEVYNTKLSVFHVNFLAAIALSASIEISKEAGKLYQISPSLTLRGVVNESSTAFGLLKDLRKICGFYGYSRSKFEKQTSLAARSLLRLLKEGAVSPYEVDKNGRTLLHNTLLCIVSEDMLAHSPAFRELVYTLLDAGVCVNEVDLAGYTAFDYLILSVGEYYTRKSERNSVGQLLANKGAEMSDIFLKAGANDRTMTIEMHSIAMLEPWQDATECGPLSLAILRESEQDVIQILRAKPSSIYELNRRKLSPLHLACCWPRGIQLLLDAGASNQVHQGDVCGGLPIRYSKKFRCLDAIELLINAGSAFSSPGWDGPSEEVLEVIDWTEIIPLFLLRTFQERRRKLFELAELTLPAEVWADLDVPTDRLLDDRAAEIQRVLIDAGIEIPKSISVPQRRGTVYHSPRWSAKQADQLWDAGFRDIDSCDESGHTPLSKCRGYSLEYAQWLLNRGADSSREICYTNKSNYSGREPVAGLTATHYMADGLGLYFTAFSNNRFSPAAFVIFEELLVNGDSHDDCHCACSSGGCATFTILLKAIGNRRSFMRKASSTPAESRKLLLQRLESPTHPASSSPMRSKIVEQVIRFETFEALQLSHTCCDFNYFGPVRWYPPEEVQEIHEEWAELLSKHEDLVSEFCHKFREVGGTLVSFLEGYWQTRMDEVLKEEKPLDEEDGRRLRELGIVLEEVSEDREKASSDGYLTDEDFIDENVTNEDVISEDLTNENQSGSSKNAEAAHNEGEQPTENSSSR